MSAKYNELTKRLLKEGYTVDNYPSYVQIDTSRLPGDDPLNNLAGGFEYKRYYRDTIVYKTGCGKYIMGENVIENMGYHGIDWCHENNNPVFRCPCDKEKCEYNDSQLHGIQGGGLCAQCWCVCHKTDDPYKYENSIERMEKELQKEKQRKYEEYSRNHGGRVCKNNMTYDERSRTWSLNYDPKRCAEICCSKDGYCPILNKKLSRKRGNVYYDLKESGAVKKEAQMSLFEKDRWERVTKNIRYLQKPCSIDICKAIVKLNQDDIRWNYEINHTREKMMDKSFLWEIYNIRAESKPSRDLIQDLQDIREGAVVVFDDDILKKQKQEAKQRRQQNKQKAVDRLEKKLIEIGYENLPVTSIDRVHADKWLDAKRLKDLESIHKQKIAEKKKNPIQISMFDYMEGAMNDRSGIKRSNTGNQEQHHTDSDTAEDHR